MSNLAYIKNYKKCIDCKESKLLHEFSKVEELQIVIDFMKQGN